MIDWETIELILALSLILSGVCLGMLELLFPVE
jgi:hypothetical protein